MSARSACIAAAIALLAGIGPATAAVVELAPATTIEWDGATEHFTYGEMTLDITTKSESEGLTTVTLTVAAPRVQSISVSAEAGGGPYVSLGVYPLDDSGADTVIFSVYTGGAHCCMQTSAITLTAGGFVIADIGMIDGDFLQPSDVDGDGTPELVLWDDRFNYTFSAYAASRPARQVFRFRDGEMYDASGEPRYVAFHEANLAELEPTCSGDSWFFADCAGYLATAALLGQFDEKFPAVKAAYDAGRFDPESGWESFSLCKDAACSEVVNYDNFIEAVVVALSSWGYIDGDTSADPAAPSGKDKLN